MNYEVQDEDEEVEVLKIHLKVIQGDQLVAKDRNLMGQWTTSDPYVTVSFFPRGLNNELNENSNNYHSEIKLGQSDTIRYTLSPQWLFETDIEVPRMYATDDCQFLVVIRDWDDDLTAGEEPPENLMGVVPVNVTPNMYRNLPFTTRTKWYGVPAASADRASGRIQCQIDVQKQRKRFSEINSAPAFKKPIGNPILDQATYTPSEAEEEFSNALRKEERQGDGSVLTDLKLLRLSVQGSVTGATGMATGVVSKSALGRMTLGAADAMKQTALGGMNGVSQVANFGVNGVKQVAVGSTNLATQAVTDSVNGVAQVATGSVNMASQVATGSVNMASQVATGSVNMAAQTMKTTAGIVSAPFGMFSSKTKNVQSPTTTRNNSTMPKSLSTRNMFSSMPFSVSGTGESSAPPMRKALSSKNLFSSMPFTTSGSGNTSEEVSSKSRRSRQTSLGGTRKAQSSRNVLKGKEKYASLLKSSGQQDDKKSSSQTSDPLSIPAQSLSKTIPLPTQQQQSIEPTETPTSPAQPPTPKSNETEKDHYKLDIAKAQQVEAAKSKEKGGGQRPRPVRQRSAPRIRKSNSTRKLQLSGGELSLEGGATLLGDRDTPGLSNKIPPTKTQQQGSGINQEETDKLAIESIKQKKLERKSPVLLKLSDHAINSDNAQSNQNDGMSKNEKMKMLEMSNSTRSKSSDPTTGTSMSDKERKKLKKEKKKMRKSKTLAASYDQQDTLPGPALRNLSGHEPGRRRSMDYPKSERRYSTASTVSEVTAASSSINVEEFEAMKTSLREKDERLLKMERELAELRQALISGASVGQTPTAVQSTSLELETTRRVSMDHATTKKYSGSVGYEQNRRASAGDYGGGGEAGRVPIMIGKQKAKYVPITSTTPMSQENEAGFYVDAEGVEYYLDPKGIEYYKDKDGEWYADFVPESKTEAEETSGWFMDVDGTKYYLDEHGVEYNENPKDGEYYSNAGQRLNLKKVSKKA